MKRTREDLIDAARRAASAAGGPLSRSDFQRLTGISRSFRNHGHDPAGCELVVCWEHDWPECPIEVLELRGVVERLGN